MSLSSEQPPFIRPAVRWLTWSVYAAAWTTALLTPQPVHVAEAVLPDSLQFPTAKLLHISAYAVFVLLSVWLPVTPRVRWLVLLLVSFHAFGTEFFQQFVPERYPSLQDVGLDHVGIFLGLTLTWRWWRQPSREPVMP
jgi:VanZ family protein